MLALLETLVNILLRSALSSVSLCVYPPVYPPAGWDTIILHFPSVFVVQTAETARGFIHSDRSSHCVVWTFVLWFVFFLPLQLVSSSSFASGFFLFIYFFFFFFFYTLSGLHPPRCSLQPYGDSSQKDDAMDIASQKTIIKCGVWLVCSFGRFTGSGELTAG